MTTQAQLSNDQRALLARALADLPSGYIWCSDDPDCRRGLCMPAATREEAANRFVSNRRRSWSDTRSYDVWTMVSPHDIPTLVKTQFEGSGIQGEQA